MKKLGVVLAVAALAATALLLTLRREQVDPSIHSNDQPLPALPSQDGPLSDPEGSVSTPNAEPAVPRKTAAESNDPNVKIVDGIRMLRGKTIHGEEVWIPEAPMPPDEPAGEPQSQPEFLPAPGAQ